MKLHLYRLCAFVTVIVAICVLAGLAALNKQFDSQVFASAITGLIGVAGSFRPSASNQQGEQ